jgi:hypothetical protein
MQDGPLTLEQLAEHAETTVGTLYTMMGTLKKQHGVVKIQPDPRQPAKYQIGGAPKPTRQEAGCRARHPSAGPPSGQPWSSSSRAAPRCKAR